MKADLGNWKSTLDRAEEFESHRFSWTGVKGRTEKKALSLPQPYQDLVNDVLKALKRREGKDIGLGL